MESLIWAGYLAFAGVSAVVAFLILGSIILIAPGLALIAWGWSMGGITGGLLLLIGIIMTGFLLAIVINGSKPSGLSNNSIVIFWR